MWTYIQIGLILLAGATLYVVFTQSVKFIVIKFKERAPIIKRYWMFVIPLLIATTLAYIVVALFFYNEINFSLVGQISGLLLAVFAGYIAFSEFGESRFDKLKESGMQRLESKELNAARIDWEEAHAIKSKDRIVLGDLLELYLMLGLYDKFDSKIEHFKRVKIEDSDNLAYYYLMSLRYLVQERIGDARKHIEASIRFVNENPGVRERLYWNNIELLKSDTYEKLGSSSKKIINNHFSYVTNKLSAQDEAKFIAGDYELSI